MNIIIFSVLTFLGLFLVAFGYTRERPIFTVGGFFVLMLVATSLANSGIDYVSGSETTDHGNGTLIKTDTYTNRSDWLVIALSRIIFHIGVFSSILEFIKWSSGQVIRNE